MDSTIKRQQHTPKKEKTRSITYRLPVKLVEEIETEAMNKNISHNVMARQILEKSPLPSGELKLRKISLGIRLISKNK